MKIIQVLQLILRDTILWKQISTLPVLETIEDVPIEFDPALWRIIVEKVLVEKDNIRFIMIGGKEYSFRIY